MRALRKQLKLQKNDIKLLQKATLYVRSLLEEVKYLFKYMFSFLRSGVEAKHDVELASTANATRIWQKMGNVVSLH